MVCRVSQQQQITSKFSLAAILVSEPILNSLRKEIRRISPSVRIDMDFIKATIQNDVLKREVVESEEAKQASDLLKKAVKATERLKAKSSSAQKPPDNNGNICVTTSVETNGDAL